MKYKKIGLMALAVFVSFLSWHAYAAFISPQIVTIESNERSAQIILNNRAPIPKIYRFSWERRVLKPNGSLELVAEGEPLPEGYHPADPYIRFSPRQVRVDPNTSQRVNFLVQRPSDLPPGEYRSHFLVEEVPLAEKKLDDLANPQGVTGQLKLMINKSIPVLLRHGKTTLSMELLNPKLIYRDGKALIDLVVTNNSTRTDYSTVTLDCFTGEEVPKKILLTTARIYPNIRTYPMTLPVGDFDLNQCKELNANIIVSRFDPEFPNQVISSKPVAR